MAQLSIIVPVYNVESYLSSCLDSILNQSYKDFELILIDDGSTDNSGIICDSYAEKDSRIIVRHQANAGVSSARNLGLDIASGELISFIDSDDIIESQMLEILVNNLHKFNCDISVCRLDIIKINGENSVIDLKKSLLLENKYVIFHYFTDPIVKEFLYGPCNKIIRKKIIGDIRFSKYALGEDILFMFNILQEAKTIYIDKFVGYHYIHRNNSAMRSKFSIKRLDYVYACQDLVEICKQRAPYAFSQANIWLFRHTLVTICQIYRNNLHNDSEFSNFIKINLAYLQSNKKSLKYLPFKRKIDFVIINYIPFVFHLF